MQIYIRVSDTGEVSASTLPLEGYLHECVLSPHAYDVRVDGEGGSTGLGSYGMPPSREVLENISKHYEIPVADMTVYGTFPEERLPDLSSAPS